MTELDALWAFLLAAVVALVATPLVARLARRVGAMDAPTERGMHLVATPRLGGVAILAGTLAAGALFLKDSREDSAAILLGALVITGVGALDDIRGLSPPVKLAGQALAALVPVAAGVAVDHVTLPFVGPFDLGWAGVPLTVLGLVAVMNVVNFTDGVDGLAAGVCTIGGLTFAAVALSLGRVEAGVLAALTAGAALGFLFHNFPARSGGASIFMGDSGSNLLGLLLACIAIQGVLKTAAVVGLFVPLVILAVPFLDTGFVVLKRIKHGRPVYAADRWHFHHRFADIGFSPLRTVLYLYLWTLTLAALALVLGLDPYSDDAGNLQPGWTVVLVLVGLVALAASVYLVYVLEILKFRRVRQFQLRRRAGVNGGQESSDEELEEQIRREVETGEFDALDSEGAGEGHG